MTKVIDCFPFFNESELLELRLAELNDVVDYFVIAEANKTHTGNPKEFNFEKNRHKFKTYLDKIVYVKVTDLPDSPPENRWVAENFQRNAITRGLAKVAKKGDKILISDADEIPSPKAIIENMNCDNWVVFSQQLFYYYVNLKASRLWGGTVMSTYSDGFSPQRRRGSTHRHSYGMYPGGGWHYSYLYGGSPKKLYYKTQNIVDFYRGYNTGTASDIKEKVKLKKDLYGRTNELVQLKLVDISEDKPKHLDSWLKKYPVYYYKEKKHE